MASIDINKYDLVAIGEFSYGFDEIWEFRYKFLKKLIRSSTKTITIYCEIYDWQAKNFMQKNYFVGENEDCNNTMFSGAYRKNKFTQPHGILHNFVPYLIESRCYHKILKYMIKHHHRIRLIGLTPDKEKLPKITDQEKDEHMFDIIKKTLNSLHVNILWAHNRYIDNRKSVHDNSKWSLGHLLRQKYKTKYCIVLSQAYEGELRWCGFYLGHKSKTHIWEKRPFYKTFNFRAHKEWRHWNTMPGVHYHIFDNFGSEFVEFGDGYYEDHVHGYYEIARSREWDYVIFWNYVTPLQQISSY